MRAFLAFEVSDEVIENLLKVQEELRGTRADIKLVERENLHFTVKFLGEIPESAVEEIDRRLKGLAIPKIPKMEIDVQGLGAFPEARRPRVVWAGVSSDTFDSICQGAQQVIDALQGVGETDMRPYHPHITMARVRSPRNIAELQKLLGAYSTLQFGKTAITSLKLKSSTLTPKGPTYQDIREYALQ